MGRWGKREYGKAWETWPRNEAGETVAPALLKLCSPLDLEAEMLQSMLEAYGIPSIRHLPGDGQFGELMLGMSGNGVMVLVPETMLAEAQALMEGEADNDELEEGI